MHSKIVVIEGIIGAGKTTLAKRLGDDLGLAVMEEPVETNPYLDVFYQDPPRYAFEMQMHLLFRRHAAQREASWRCANGAKGVVLDRSLPGDRVFCRLHRAAGNIGPLGWETYDHAFHIMTVDMLPPRIMVYLDTPPDDAIKRVRARGRAVEGGVDLSYLKALSAGYEELLAEIASGRHHWSMGMRVVRVPWHGEPWADGRLEEVVEMLE